MGVYRGSIHNDQNLGTNGIFLVEYTCKYVCMYIHPSIHCGTFQDWNIFRHSREMSDPAPKGMEQP